MPKVSVILTSFNHEKYIASSIESVLNQSFSDFELLIVDDGSTDSSQKIIRSYKDKRIKLFLHEKNIGAVNCYLQCIKAAKGKFIALQHSDDIWNSEKLQKQVDFLEKNSKYEVCFTQVKFIDEHGEIYNLPKNHPYKNTFKQENRPREMWLNHLFWFSNCFCHPTMLIRNSSKNFAIPTELFQLPDYFQWVNFCTKKSPYVLQEELISFRLRRENQNSVSSLSLEKNIRISNELYFVAREFLPVLRDEKFFLNVFPEAEKYLTDGKISTKFAFAQLCLKRNLPAFQKLALEILRDLLHNDGERKLIKKLYGYDEKNFFRETGNLDVFGIKAQLPILNCRLYFDFGGDFNENDSVANPVLILPDNNFTANFDFDAEKEIVRLRFDPDEKAALSIKILKILVNGELAENFISNAFQVVDGYFNFLTADPFFIIDKKISAGKIHVEILGAVKNDALSDFEKKYSATCATLQEKISQVQQLESSLQEKISQVQQSEISLQEKFSQVQQLKSSLQEKNSQIRQLEISLQEKNSQIRQLQNLIDSQNQQLNSKNTEIQGLQNLQNEILNSNSWKITKPLRSIGKIIKKF